MHPVFRFHKQKKNCHGSKLCWWLFSQPTMYVKVKNNVRWSELKFKWFFWWQQWFITTTGIDRDSISNQQTLLVMIANIVGSLNSDKQCMLPKQLLSICIVERGKYDFPRSHFFYNIMFTSLKYNQPVVLNFGVLNFEKKSLLT